MKSIAKVSLPLLFLLTLALVMRAAESPPAPRVRPTDWAQPVIGAKLDNFFRVSDGLFRSEQPELADLPALQTLGIRAVLTLRDHHDDPKKFAAAGLVLLRYESSAGSLTEADLIAGLRLLRDAPKPVLVHCWHGSDRTGAVVAAWRMVFQGWAKDAAIDELVNGGYGFHAKTFPDIVPLLRALDVERLRAQLTPAAAKPPAPPSAP
jgi:tyrosine-protein phosphatase SIW14